MSDSELRHVIPCSQCGHAVEIECPEGAERDRLAGELAQADAAMQDDHVYWTMQVDALVAKLATTEAKLAAFVLAAKQMDWFQVRLNGGPPCFYIEEDGRFCGRAKRWEGHARTDAPFHAFVSLDRALTPSAKEEK